MATSMGTVKKTAYEIASCLVGSEMCIRDRSSAGALAGGSTVADVILLPAWLKAWMPPELMGQWEALVSSAGPIVQAVLEAVPALAGAVTFLAWALWGVGAVVLVALAAGIHILIALAQRRGGGPGTPQPALVR